MKQYAIGLITGALLGISAMMFMGSENKNLGVITSDSITLVSESGMTIILGGAVIIDDSDGKETVYLGTGEGGLGFLSTYNKHKVMTGYFGTNTDNVGMILLSDRYGDEGWSASAKK